MAPRGGGGGGGGGSSSDGSSTSSSSSSCNADYPCTSELMFMYGHRDKSLYSSPETYGQLIAACLWGAALFCLLILSCSSRSRSGSRAGAAKTGLAWLRFGMFLFLTAMAFLCARHALILGGANVPIGYRFEASVVVKLQLLGMAMVLAATHAQTRAHLPTGRALWRVVFVLGLVAYLALGIAYGVLDFILSADAVSAFKDTWVWPLGDRDFALTMDASMIRTLKTGATGAGLSPNYIASRLWSDPEGNQDGSYFYLRGTQIKLGIATDAIALALAVGLFLQVLEALLPGRRKEDVGRRTSLLVAATIGLVLTTLFNIIIDGYYLLWNWGIISSSSQWASFISEYPTPTDIFTSIVPPNGFLPAYRVAVGGFPVVRAVLEPFGVVLACAAITVLVWAEARDRRRHIVFGDSMK